MKWSHIFWLALATLLLNIIAYWSISATKISEGRLEEIGRKMTYHGIKEATCDAGGQGCYFYRNGEKIKL